MTRRRGRVRLQAGDLSPPRRWPSPPRCRACRRARCAGAGDDRVREERRQLPPDDLGGRRQRRGRAPAGRAGSGRRAAPDRAGRQRRDLPDASRARQFGARHCRRGGGPGGHACLARGQHAPDRLVTGLQDDRHGARHDPRTGTPDPDQRRHAQHSGDRDRQLPGRQLLAGLHPAGLFARAQRQGLPDLQRHLHGARRRRHAGAHHAQPPQHRAGVGTRRRSPSLARSRPAAAAKTRPRATSG